MAIIKTSNYIVKPNDNFFFDTNVWLHIYAPFSEYNIDKQKKFSSFFEKVIDRDAIIWVNSMVISEIANVIVRDRYKKYKFDNKVFDLKFKDFWKKKEKITAVEDAKSIINLILELDITEQMPDSFNSINIEKDLDKYYGSLDYNDAFITHLCVQKGYLIVTEDADFLDFKHLLTNIIN
ncbi:type II toxin-antitoxin system VapC family toxin [Tenacibaculum ovolyticum]|uniref:type II toxin-antitoxin system VapC family toxin n=1 Tax=Tenacibaculum ovolyticum TaxID=104270 RepID=UPI003BA929B7